MYREEGQRAGCEPVTLQDFSQASFDVASWLCYVYSCHWRHDMKQQRGVK